MDRNGSGFSAPVCEERMSRVIGVDTLLNTPEEETEYFADKLIPTCGLTIVAGESGIGKSHLLISILLSIASGEDALGRLETQPARILLFTEDDERILTPYIHRIGRNFPNVNAELIRVCVEPNGYADFERTMREEKPQIAVIDPIIALGGVSDSSRDTDVSNFLRDLKKLSNEVDCAIVFTRHLNKADPKVVYTEENIFNRISGSYAWKSTTYHRLIMWKDRNFKFRLSCSSKVLDDYHWELNCDLSKGAILLEETNGTEIKRRTSKWRNPIMSVAREHSDTYFLPGAMTAMIMQKFGKEGVNKDAVRKEMRNLADSGNLVPHEEARGTSYKYCVGLGEAIVASVAHEHMYASPVSLSEYEYEEEVGV